MMEILIGLFERCVGIMHGLAEITNTTYEEINAIVFLIIQPGLVLIFFLLWRYEKKCQTELNRDLKEEP